MFYLQLNHKSIIKLRGSDLIYSLMRGSMESLYLILNQRLSQKLHSHITKYCINRYQTEYSSLKCFSPSSSNITNIDNITNLVHIGNIADIINTVNIANIVSSIFSILAILLILYQCLILTRWAFLTQFLLLNFLFVVVIVLALFLLFQTLDPVVLASFDILRISTLAGLLVENLLSRTRCQPWPSCS